MPGTHPRNAGLAVNGWTASEAAFWGHDIPRLALENRGQGDAIIFLADDRQGRDAVVAIMARKHTTRARTLARRRETVQRAQEAADVLGWTLTADEKAMLGHVLG